MRINGVHHQESVGTGPVARVTLRCCLFKSSHGPIGVHHFPPTSITRTMGMGDIDGVVAVVAVGNHIQ